MHQKDSKQFSSKILHFISFMESEALLLFYFLICAIIQFSRFYFYFRRADSPELIKSPLPNHGLKKRYSGDFSRYTWLLSTSSMSRGSTRKTRSLGPAQSLITSLYSLPFRRIVLKTTWNKEFLNYLVCSLPATPENHETKIKLLNEIHGDITRGFVTKWRQWKKLIKYSYQLLQKCLQHCCTGTWFSNFKLHTCDVTYSLKAPYKTKNNHSSQLKLSVVSSCKKKSDQLKQYAMWAYYVITNEIECHKSQFRYKIYFYNKNLNFFEFLKI